MKPLTPPAVLLAPIQRVTVFEDRARVQRRSSAPFALPTDPAGSNQGERIAMVCIAQVSPLLVERSLVARAKGARVVEARVERRWVALDQDKPEHVQALGQKQRQLALNLAELDATLAQHGAALDEIRGLAVRLLGEAAEDVSYGKTPRAELLTELDELSQREHRLQGTLLELSAMRKNLRVEHQDVVAQQQAQYSPEQQLQASLLITLSYTEPTLLELEVDYTVPCACWRPHHTFELVEEGEGAAENTARVRAETAASVWQNTGEAWREVELVFSTARPSLGTSPPLLHSDLLRSKPREEHITVQAREQKITTTGLAQGESAEEEMPGIDDGGEALALQALSPESVESNGRAHRVDLFTFDSAATLSLVCMPELKEAVVLRSVQVNDSPRALLAGPCDLLRSRGLLGRALIEFVAARESFELGWGADPELYVQRSKTSHTTEPSLLNSWHTTRYAIEIRIKNLGPKPKRFTVAERIPVSELEKLRIELHRESTQPQSSPDENGFLRWEIALSPFESSVVKLSYEVKRHPDVAGLLL